MVMDRRGRECCSHLWRGAGRCFPKRRFVDAHGVAAPDEIVAGPGLRPQHGQQNVSNDPRRKASPAQRPTGDEGEQGLGAYQKQGGERDARPSAQPELGRGERGRARSSSRLVVRISGAKCSGKVARRRRAQRICRDQTSFSRRAPEGLLERLTDEMGVAALGVDELGRRRVFGDLGAERFDAPAGLEDVAPPQHRLALGEAESGGLGRILPARLIGVEKGALDLRAERLGPRPDRRRADDAGVGAPARQAVAGYSRLASARWNWR